MSEPGGVDQMQQKPDVTPRTSFGVPAEIIAVPPIIEFKGVAQTEAHMRMDPRILDRIHDVVAVLQRDYTDVLASQVENLTDACATLINDTETATKKIYAIAHEIRGIAGTFARPLAGQVAAHICEFLDDQSSVIASTPEMLQEKVEVLVQIAGLSPEPEGLFATVVLERLKDITQSQQMTPLNLNAKIAR